MRCMQECYRRTGECLVDRAITEVCIGSEIKKKKKVRCCALS
jgi:hypothetical protein